METIVEPATTIYGHLFEYRAILEWVREKGACPITNQPLRENQITVLYGLKDTIANLRRLRQENRVQRRRIEQLEEMHRMRQENENQRRRIEELEALAAS